MLSHVWSSTVHGVDALPIEIETHAEPSVPNFQMVGLPDSVVKESRTRVFSAINNSGLSFPRGRLVINLAPADVPKEGSAFDLPIAIGLLAAAGSALDTAPLDDLYILGELSLDGSVRSVRGVLPMAVRAKQEGRLGILVPKENASEAAVVEGLRVYPVGTLLDAFHMLRDFDRVTPFRIDARRAFHNGPSSLLDMADVRGQENVKRALEVAAAGGHNVLMVGPPGAGKTMMARRLPTILPPFSLEEAIETTKIHSVGGKLNGAGLVAGRPFRAPHHTVSDVGLCGGGSNPMPGEISLAHNGVLFLDELPEFRRSALEVLRQPLEEGRVTISRARISVDYPARFMLVASMNPCPCGYANDPTRDCACSPQNIQKYLARVSGPLMDRIDMHIEVTPVPFEELSLRQSGPKSTEIRDRITDCRMLQGDRFKETPGVYCNAQMTTRQVKETCRLDDTGQALMKAAMQRIGLSARAFHRILKVARTISDLAGEEGITTAAVAEAIQYRTLDRESRRG